MYRTTDLPELLAPAGSPEALWAAVEAGADAVYIAGKRFGARAFAPNFEQEELRMAVIYCHLHGVKLYVTVNTLIYDRELKEAIDFARALYEMGVDALIIADVGLMAALRRQVPGLALHASTQMFLHNSAAVAEATRLGVCRAVVARECSLEAIGQMVRESPVELEVFVHGALCVCHSGQCLFSSMVGGRSGNRGECAQPCRLPYNGAYPLSLKDLSLAAHIPALIESGVASLKVEGRMKSPEYVYHVIKLYRTLLDERRGARPEEASHLAAIFSRGGHTDGYFTGRMHRGMTGVRSEEDKARSRQTEGLRFAPRPVPIRAEARFASGTPASMTVFFGDLQARVEGDIPATAKSAPLNAEDLTSRLCKMGGTYVSLPKESVSLSLEEGINLSPGAVNALRRGAVEALYRALSTPSQNDTSHAQLAAPAVPISDLPPDKSGEGKPVLRTALFFSREVLSRVSDATRAYFDRIFLPLADYRGGLGADGVYLPPVIMPSQMEAVGQLLAAAKAQGAVYALVGNLSHLSLVRRFGLLPMGDLRLNVCNGESAAQYRAMGVEPLLLSPELTLPRMRDIGGGAVVYGRLPLMLTERCFVKENGGCERCGRFSFTDRKGKSFPVLREYLHRNLIFNSLPTYMGDRLGEVREAGLLVWHFLFTVESAAEIDGVVTRFLSGACPEGEVRRIHR